MKCEFCGSNMEIEQLYCPACGRKNEHAQKHREDMLDYKQQFRQTKEEVIGNSRRFNTKTAFIAIICILITLSTGCFLTRAYSYEIRSWYREKNIAAHKEEYYKEISRLMENKDYIGLYFYTRKSELDFSKSMKKYDHIFNCARYYYRIYYYTLYIYEKDCDPDVLSDTIGVIATNIINLQEEGSDEYLKDEEKTPENMEFLEGTKKDATDFVKAYFKLTDEEAEGMFGMTKARLTVMLEDAFNERK